MVKQFWPSKPKVNTITEIGNATADIDKGNILNSFFSTIGEKLSDAIDSSDCTEVPVPNINTEFSLKEITVSELHSAFKDLKSSNSCGVDGLTTRLLRQAGNIIFAPLLHIVNTSIAQGCFPNCWKTSSITPLYKENDPTKPENYRPISILPCLGKLLEKIVHQQLYQYISTNNILSAQQSGFRKGYSTGTCLIDFLDNIYQNIDKKRTCGVLFLDLKKAFDTVDHKILVNKLSQIGITPASCNWFKSYLEDCRQVTRVGQELSCSLPVTCGVPQGSILGPLLFSIYVNNLPLANPDLLTYLYADDTAIIVQDESVSNIECKLQMAIENVANWFKLNKLSLNCGKSKIMHFGTPYQVANVPDMNIVYNGQSIEVVIEYKYLGVKLDCNLNFTSNTQYIFSKLNKRIHMLGRARTIVNSDICLYLYNQLILPVLDYADFIYDGLSQYNEFTLQRLQNGAARRILRVSKQTPSVYTHNTVHMDNLAIRRKKHTCIMPFKILNGLSPPALGNKFTFIHDVSSKTTRQSQDLKLYIPKPRLELTKKSFVFRASALWNELPIHVRQCDSLNSFKIALDIHFSFQ